MLRQAKQDVHNQFPEKQMGQVSAQLTTAWKAQIVGCVHFSFPVLASPF